MSDEPGSDYGNFPLKDTGPDDAATFVKHCVMFVAAIIIGGWAITQCSTDSHPYPDDVEKCWDYQGGATPC